MRWSTRASGATWEDRTLHDAGIGMARAEVRQERDEPHGGPALLVSRSMPRTRTSRSPARRRSRGPSAPAGAELAAFPAASAAYMIGPPPPLASEIVRRARAVAHAHGLGGRVGLRAGVGERTCAARPDRPPTARPARTTGLDGIGAGRGGGRDDLAGAGRVVDRDAERWSPTKRPSCSQSRDVFTIWVSRSRPRCSQCPASAAPAGRPSSCPWRPPGPRRWMRLRRAPALR